MTSILRHWLLICAVLFPGLSLAQEPATDSLNPEQACVSEILRVDDSLGTIRNHACETRSLSETITSYLQSLEALNYQNCPPAFRQAFRQHQGAWYDMLSVTDRYPHLRGEMHLLFKELESSEDADMFAAVLQRIGDSWSEVKLAAASGN